LAATMEMRTLVPALNRGLGGMIDDMSVVSGID